MDRQEQLRQHLSHLSAREIAKALAEKEGFAAKERKRKSQLLLEKRHAAMKKIERLVIAEWSRDPSAFPSASKALRRTQVFQSRLRA
ncbi:hypothetical protein [Paraburkholderia sp. 31.1]|nr:hypothetical protein [Paraburkholderia sp. 31.1]MBC8725739.1 hypothetical protein [Paraburkholderia sp. 31.1]